MQITRAGEVSQDFALVAFQITGEQSTVQANYYLNHIMWAEYCPLRYVGQ